MNRRWWIVLAAVALIAIGGWLWASPYWTVSTLKQAADARDLATISAHVDYPAVRTSLKGQLRDRVIRPRSGSAIEALGAQLVQRFSEPLVDTLVTPEGLQAVFERRPTDDTARPKRIVLRADDMRMRRTGLTSFVLQRGDDGGALVFRLEGIGWKLTEVQLPADLKL